MLLGNHSAQSPASVWVASPGHAMGHCKIKCSLCSERQVRCSLLWGLRQGLAGGLWVLHFCCFIEFPEEVAALANHSAQSPASV